MFQRIDTNHSRGWLKQKKLLLEGPLQLLLRGRISGAHFARSPELPTRLGLRDSHALLSIVSEFPCTPPLMPTDYQFVSPVRRDCYDIGNIVDIINFL
jgi:hypothetical protein